MNSVNMRSKKTADEFKLLAELFKARKEKVSTRKQYEKDIEEQNTKIIGELAEKLSPIAAKTRSQIYFIIEDGKCGIEIEVKHTDRKKAVHTTLLRREIGNIHNFNYTEKNLRTLLRTIERNIRQMRLLIPKADNITMGPKDECKAIVLIKTRTRYF